MFVASWTNAATVGTLTLCLWAEMAGTGDFLLARLGQNMPLYVLILEPMSFVILLTGLRTINARWMMVLAGFCLLVIIASSLPSSVPVAAYSMFVSCRFLTKTTVFWRSVPMEINQPSPNRLFQPGGECFGHPSQF